MDTGHGGSGIFPTAKAVKCELTRFCTPPWQTQAGISTHRTQGYFEEQS